MEKLAPYLIELAIGVIIVGLLKYTFTREKTLLMTKEDHHKFCGDVKKEAEISREKMHKETRDSIKQEFAAFREYFDVEMENKVLKSLRNLNGTLEEKIADVVANKVSILNKELTDKIDKKLDLIDVLKVLAIKKE